MKPLMRYKRMAWRHRWYRGWLKRGVRRFAPEIIRDVVAMKRMVFDCQCEKGVQHGKHG